MSRWQAQSVSWAATPLAAAACWPPIKLGRTPAPPHPHLVDEFDQQHVSAHRRRQRHAQPVARARAASRHRPQQRLRHAGLHLQAARTGGAAARAAVAAAAAAASAQVKVLLRTQKRLVVALALAAAALVHLVKGQALARHHHVRLLPRTQRAGQGRSSGVGAERHGWETWKGRPRSLWQHQTCSLDAVTGPPSLHRRQVIQPASTHLLQVGAELVLHPVGQPGALRLRPLVNVRIAAVCGGRAQGSGWGGGAQQGKAGVLMDVARKARKQARHQAASTNRKWLATRTNRLLACHVAIQAQAAAIALIVLLSCIGRRRWCGACCWRYRWSSGIACRHA